VIWVNSNDHPISAAVGKIFYRSSSFLVRVCVNTVALPHLRFIRSVCADVFCGRCAVVSIERSSVCPIMIPSHVSDADMPLTTHGSVEGRDRQHGGFSYLSARTIHSLPALRQKRTCHLRRDDIFLPLVRSLYYTQVTFEFVPATDCISSTCGPC